MFPRWCYPRRTPDIQSDWIITKCNTNVFDQPVNLLIQLLKLRVIQHIEMGNPTLNIG
jgi:hypothetical protein